MAHEDDSVDADIAADAPDSEPATSYEMGRIYVEGMSEDEDDADSAAKEDSYADYEEVEDEDDSKAGRTRKLLSSKTADVDPEMGSRKDDDPFMENFNFDPDENYPE